MLRTALYNNHQELKAKFVPFAGFEMPIFYADGMVKEHNYVRENAGLFDVSHMGQAYISGERVEEFLSIITPTNFKNTELYKAKYTVLLNENATIIDDLIFYKMSDSKFFVVFNASRKEQDLAWLRKHAENFDCNIEYLEDRSLIALQGPNAANYITQVLKDDFANLQYMSICNFDFGDHKLLVSKTGYTGEKGFEISVANDFAGELWNKFISEGVPAIGLGARDSLRLEAGYPLYGHELSEETNLSEVTLKWIVTSNENFIGKDKINDSPSKKRVSIKLLDKGIIRDGMKIFNEDNQEIGIITSGGFCPTLGHSIAQASIAKEYAKKDTKIIVQIRKDFKSAIVTKLNQLQTKIAA